MLDIETLGVGALPVITQIGACYFDRSTGEIGDTFLVNIDIDDSLKNGFNVDGETLDWWFSQNRKTFLSNTTTAQDALCRFNFFAAKAKTIWSHATFDFPIIMYAMKKFYIQPQFRYTAARDIRTLADLAGGEKINTKYLKTHDALDDCKHQVEYCVEYLNRLKK